MRETHVGQRYIPGTYWKECDECGFDFLRSELRKRWDEAIVCSSCWDPIPRDLERRDYTWNGIAKRSPLP